MGKLYISHTILLFAGIHDDQMGGGTIFEGIVELTFNVKSFGKTMLNQPPKAGLHPKLELEREN